jgi:HxlR-like helix-turn-helix
MVDEYDETLCRLDTADGKVRLAIDELLEELGSLPMQAAEPDLASPFVLSADERRSSTANTIFRDPTWRKKDPSGSLAHQPGGRADWWTPLVLRDAISGVRRFDDFQSNLGIPRAVLAARLDRLVESGMLRKVQYEERPARSEYRLTEKGRAFLGCPRREVARGLGVAVERGTSAGAPAR